jgi:class 3 adenylate cyclase
LAGAVETVTVLFTDLVGSTELASRIGPERAEELRQEHFGLLREAIAAANGREVKNLGDGLMVVLPSAAAAMECAMSMQQRIELRNRSAKDAFSVRVGVSMGDATREEGDYFGPPVVEASRLCARASAGQVLLPELTRLMVGRRGDHRFSSLGEMELKGLPEPVAVCELGWDSLPAAMVPLPGRLQVLPETAYVGREGVRKRLGALWDQARGGEGRFALIAGEPGIGKTRLSTHVAIQAHASGAVVLYGRCDEELRVPYQPWLEALGEMAQTAPVEVLETFVAAHGGELRRLVPVLGNRVSGVPEPRASDPETERYLLFGAVLGLLDVVSSEQPAVLVLDDLHWADKPTLVLLKHVISTAGGLRLLVIGTFRDSDVSADHPLTALLADLAREHAVERIDLAGLERAEVVSLMEAAAGHELDADGMRLADEVTRDTDGNPFFVAEILRHLLESGAVVQGADGRYSVATQLGELGLPRSVRAVVGQRVRRLGEAAVAALSVASVIGREFDLGVLARVSERSEDELLDVLDDAVVGSVLRESLAQPGRFMFAHALINHTLYAELGRTRRARLHRRIAEALEELPSEERDQRLPELAHHWAAATQAVDRAKAVMYSRLAGERALAQLAPDEALRRFEEALDLLESSPGQDEADRCELLIGRGEAQRQVGDPEYRETLLEAGEIARRLSDPDRMARAALANNRGWFSAAGEVDRARVEALQAALDALPAGSDHRPRLLAQLAAELCWAGSFQGRVQPLVDESLALARAGGDARVLAHVLSLALAAIQGPHLLEQRIRLADELLAVADSLEDPLPRFGSAVWRYITALETADIEEVDASLKRMSRMADEYGQPWMRWLSLSFHACRSQLAGDLARAEERAAQAVTFGTETGQLDAFIFFGAQIGVLRHEQGRLEEIVELYAQRAAENPGMPMLQAVVTFYYAELERLNEASSRLNAVTSQAFTGLSADITWLIAMARYAQVASRMRALDAAEKLYELLLPYRTRIAHSTVTVVGSVELVLGMLAATLGRERELDEHFAAAEATHERIGAKLILARTRLEWARALLERGDARGGARARRMLEQARELARELGGVDVERRADTLLASMSVAGRPSRTKA